MKYACLAVASVLAALLGSSMAEAAAPVSYCRDPVILAALMDTLNKDETATSRIVDITDIRDVEIGNGERYLACLGTIHISGGASGLRYFGYYTDSADRWITYFGTEIKRGP